MYKVLILAVFLSISAVSATFWTPCGGSATTHYVFSNVCNDERCSVVRGQSFIANTTISFAAAHPRLNIRVRTVWLGITITLPLFPPHDDGCNGLFLNGQLVGCPTQVGPRYQWVLESQIPANVPAMQNIRVFTELLDDNDNLISCSSLIADVV
ncbi:hypothetical protein PVAND_003430 [Polypedilum vanderplanki]|uniref:MD-2-related lipid-recognition domain-containing protein n=1 Tax=Polypedilum vanderplanki TaxID=319348 RepID=A0A9J6BVS2_POLVA|nr:hypothetical protein PVAND_003430 [Polypedilum vanderplanki]